VKYDCQRSQSSSRANFGDTHKHTRKIISNNGLHTLLSPLFLTFSISRQEASEALLDLSFIIKRYFNLFSRCMLSNTTRQILIHRRHVSAYIVAIFRRSANVRTNSDHCTVGDTYCLRRLLKSRLELKLKY
jgi:hypothetical protein